jgi:hypothetical protein
MRQLYKEKEKDKHKIKFALLKNNANFAQLVKSFSFYFF